MSCSRPVQITFASTQSVFGSSSILKGPFSQAPSQSEPSLLWPLPKVHALSLTVDDVPAAGVEDTCRLIVALAPADKK